MFGEEADLKLISVDFFWFIPNTGHNGLLPGERPDSLNLLLHRSYDYFVSNLTVFRSKI